MKVIDFKNLFVIADSKQVYANLLNEKDLSTPYGDYTLKIGDEQYSVHLTGIGTAHKTEGGDQKYFILETDVVSFSEISNMGFEIKDKSQLISES